MGPVSYTHLGIRPFQITDTGGKYSFGDYLGLRLLTCGAAVLTGMGYVFLNGYSFEKAAVVFLMVVYKVIDALEMCIRDRICTMPSLPVPMEIWP